MAFPLTPERPARPCGHRFAQAIPPQSAQSPLPQAVCSASDVPVCEAAAAPLWLRYCIAISTGAFPDEVDDVSSLSEPHGPDRAMAERGRVGAEIPQPRAARRLRQAVRAARRRPRTDLAHLADLYPPGLRHRQGDGGQSGTGGDGGSRLRDAVRLAAAFQEGEFAGTAAHAAGGADVRPFRHAAARHREDAAAGPRRLHHRLAQSARHSARARQVRPRRIHRAPHHLPRSNRSARAHGGDLPAVGVGAGRRRDHVGGQPPGAPGDADPDGRPDRHPHSTHQGQRIRQEQADQMVRGEPDQLRAVPVQGRVPRRSIPASCSSPPSCR